MGASGSMQDWNRYNGMGSASGGALTDLYGKLQQNGVYGGQSSAPAQLSIINPTRSGLSDRHAESLDRRGLYYANVTPATPDQRVRQGKDGAGGLANARVGTNPPLRSDHAVR